MLTLEMFQCECWGRLLWGSEGCQEALQALVGQGGFAIVQGKDSEVGEGGTRSAPDLDPLYPGGQHQAPTSRCCRGCGTPPGSPPHHAVLPAWPRWHRAGGQRVRCPPRRSTVLSPRHGRDGGTPPLGSPAPQTACRGTGWA